MGPRCPQTLLPVPVYVSPTPTPELILVDVWVAEVDKRRCNQVVRARTTEKRRDAHRRRRAGRTSRASPPRLRSSLTPSFLPHSRRLPRAQLKDISAALPLTDMPHVKRVRRVAAADASPESLKVLLCPVGVSAAGAADWPAAASALVERHALTPERAQVPGLAPRTGSSGRSGRAYGPSCGRNPTGTLARTPRTSRRRRRRRCRWMSRALSRPERRRREKRNRTLGGVGGSRARLQRQSRFRARNAVLLVDPAVPGSPPSAATRRAGGRWRRGGYENERSDDAPVATRRVRGDRRGVCVGHRDARRGPRSRGGGDRGCERELCRFRVRDLWRGGSGRCPLGGAKRAREKQEKNLG